MTQHSRTQSNNIGGVWGLNLTKHEHTHSDLLVTIKVHSAPPQLFDPVLRLFAPLPRLSPMVVAGGAQDVAGRRQTALISSQHEGCWEP